MYVLPFKSLLNKRTQPAIWSIQDAPWKAGHWKTAAFASGGRGSEPSKWKENSSARQCPTTSEKEGQGFWTANRGKGGFQPDDNVEFDKLLDLDGPTLREQLT